MDLYESEIKIKILHIEHYKTLSPRIGALPDAVTDCERRVDGEDGG